MTKGKEYQALVRRIRESIKDRRHDEVTAICLSPVTMANVTGGDLFDFLAPDPPITRLLRERIPIRYMVEIPEGDYVISSEQRSFWFLGGNALPSGTFSGTFTASNTWTIPNTGSITFTYDTSGKVTVE